MKELALAKIDIVKFNSTKSEVAAKYAGDEGKTRKSKTHTRWRRELVLSRKL